MLGFRWAIAPGEGQYIAFEVIPDRPRRPSRLHAQTSGRIVLMPVRFMTGKIGGDAHLIPRPTVLDLPDDQQELQRFPGQAILSPNIEQDGYLASRQRSFDGRQAVRSSCRARYCRQAEAQRYDGRSCFHILDSRAITKMDR